MRIHKFNNATPEDLKTTVFEEVGLQSGSGYRKYLFPPMPRW